MGHVPGFAGETAEVHLRADDLVELRREPLGLGDEVELGNPGAGGAQGQLQPFGVDLRLPTGSHQGRDIVGVDEIGRQPLIGVAHGPVFATQPIGLAVRARVGRLVVEDMFALGAAAVQLGGAGGRLGQDLFDPFAEVVASGQASHLLPSQARRQKAPIEIEQGHGNRGATGGRQQRLEQRFERGLR